MKLLRWLSIIFILIPLLSLGAAAYTMDPISRSRGADDLVTGSSDPVQNKAIEASQERSQEEVE